MKNSKSFPTLRETLFHVSINIRVASGVRTHNSCHELYMRYLRMNLLVSQFYQCYWSYYFHWLSSFQVLLVLQLCWFTNSAGSLVLLVHQFCWFASSVRSLVPLAHQFCWFASSVGSLVLLVQQFRWFASSVSSLVLLVRYYRWFDSSVGWLVLVVC